MSLYLKYRPETFEQIQGNNEHIPSLKKMVEDVKKCPHVFLLHGPTGCGKTTIARIIASELNSSGSDLREINTADFRGIDTIRDIIRQSQFKPLESACKVWIIDECHKLTGDAQNAMLKILEDTPPKVYFILCTTEPQKLLPTIKNRSSQFQVKLLTDNQMYKLLKKVTRAENERLDKKVYEQIIQDSFGHPRSALQILEQVLATEEGKRLQVAKKQAEELSESIELCRSLISRTGWKKIQTILNGLKDQDPESIRRHVLAYCQSVLLKGDDERAGLIMEEFIEPFYTSGFPGLVLACYSIIKN